MREAEFSSVNLQISITKIFCGLKQCNLDLRYAIPLLSMCRLEIAPYLLSPACLHITSQPAGADLANSQKFVYRWQHLLSKTSFDSTLHRNINCQKYKVKINVRFKY